MQCVLFGVTGIWPVYVLVQNAMGLGTTGAVMAVHDKADLMVLYILPHGMLEMTCIFVAAAAGLHVFWAWVAPGHRTRGEALDRGGASAGDRRDGAGVRPLPRTGLVEGFVTGWALPWPVKIGIGAAALAVFLIYMLVIGGRAHRQGETGRSRRIRSGHPAPGRRLTSGTGGGRPGARARSRSGSASETTAAFSSR